MALRCMSHRLHRLSINNALTYMSRSTYAVQHPCMSFITMEGSQSETASRCSISSLCAMMPDPVLTWNVWFTKAKLKAKKRAKAKKYKDGKKLKRGKFH